MIMVGILPAHCEKTFRPNAIRNRAIEPPEKTNPLLVAAQLSKMKR